jgi:two-component system, NtrC family, response regulator HydG
MIRILIADDDQGLRFSVKSALSSSPKFTVEEAVDGQDAVEKFHQENFDVVLLDVDMPRMNGLEALKQIKDKNPGAIVIMMTAYAAIHQAVQAVKDGAFNYLSKPVDSDDLEALINRAVAAQAMISSIAASSPTIMENGRKIIGNNQQMVRVFGMIHRLAKVDTPVLIRGASGTGKELVARAIHFNSSRKDGKFVAINCSAIPENLFESELFGHEKGSFTGADQRKLGKFQYAEGGTLFLDEVGDLPVLMQVKLLRVLQEKLFTPVGSNREIPTNVRIIAATNRPLEDMMKAGSFREDLFYRLNVIPIFLPSLCERKDDLPNLINMFIKKFNEAHQRKITGMTSDALAVLKKYDWPGNIRELENVIEHAFVMEAEKVITLASLPPLILSITGTVLPEVAEPAVNSLNTSALAKPVVSSPFKSDDSIEDHDEDLLSDDDGDDADMDITVDASALDFNAEKEAFEKEFIIKALKTFKGRINQTALHANIPKKTLLRKIEKYGIKTEDYKN